MNFPKFLFKDITSQSQTIAQDPKPKLCIRKPEQSRQGIQLASEAEQILLPSFVTLILGKPGSGKSHLISQMLSLRSFYNCRFDRVIYVGPTRYQGVIHDEYNTIASCDVNFISKRIQQASPWAQNMLIVMDDVISQIPMTQKNRLQQIFYNRRHELKMGTISIIVTAQKYTSVPTWIRTTLSSIFAFPISKSQVKTLMNQIPNCLASDMITHKFALLHKHSFLYFNLQSGKVFDNQFVLV